MKTAMRCLLGTTMVGLLWVSATGCGSQRAEEGSKAVPSTDMFKHNKAVKSPPPQKPER